MIFDEEIIGGEDANQLDELAYAEKCIHACSGLPDGAIDGGWTAYGMSTYAKRIETEIISLRKDAMRYRWLRGSDGVSRRWSLWNIQYWDGKNGWEPMQRERMDAMIDAALNDEAVKVSSVKLTGSTSDGGKSSERSEQREL